MFLCGKRIMSINGNLCKCDQLIEKQQQRSHLAYAPATGIANAHWNALLMISPTIFGRCGVSLHFIPLKWPAFKRPHTHNRAISLLTANLCIAFRIWKFFDLKCGILWSQPDSKHRIWSNVFFFKYYTKNSDECIAFELYAHRFNITKQRNKCVAPMRNGCQ